MRENMYRVREQWCECTPPPPSCMTHLPAFQTPEPQTPGHIREGGGVGGPERGSGWNPSLRPPGHRILGHALEAALGTDQPPTLLKVWPLAFPTATPLPPPATRGTINIRAKRNSRT